MVTTAARRKFAGRSFGNRGGFCLDVYLIHVRLWPSGVTSQRHVELQGLVRRGVQQDLDGNSRLWSLEAFPGVASSLFSWLHTRKASH